MSRTRTPFNKLSPELSQLANKINFIEQYYKITTHSFGTNDHRRKNQFSLCQNMLHEELKKTYNLIGKKLESLNV